MIYIINYQSTTIYKLNSMYTYKLPSKLISSQPPFNLLKGCNYSYDVNFFAINLFRFYFNFFGELNNVEKMSYFFSENESYENISLKRYPPLFQDGNQMLPNTKFCYTHDTPLPAQQKKPLCYLNLKVKSNIYTYIILFLY